MQPQSDIAPTMQNEIYRLKQTIKEQQGEIHRLRTMINYRPDIDRLVPMSVDGIFAKVCEFYKMDYAMLSERNRQAERIMARMAACYIACKVYRHTFKSVGDAFKPQRDHTTIMNACSRALESIETNKAFARQINIIIQNIENEFIPVPIAGGDANS
jgi:chromosomal replication initiation ATPase DnaA